MASSKKVLTDIVKPLRGRGIAGMLPRTMSPGNDAFTPKDAASDVSKEALSGNSDKPDSAASDSAKPDSAASDSAKPDSASSDEGSTSQDAGQNADKERDKPDQVGSAQKASSKSARRAPRDDDDDERLVPPQTEDEIDVPKKHTIYLLGVMSVLTVVLWFAAKLTCNVHPDQVRIPKHFSTRDLAADPKNAAFEFHHKFETGDFTTAFDLATGDMKPIVEGKLKECEQNADDCAKNQQKLEGTIESTGKVLERSESRASVELLSIYKNASGKKTFAFDVVKEGEFWRVASRREVAPVAAQPANVPAAPPASAAPVEMPDQSSSPAQ